jgi:tRNA/tmRNA/rRNA uracil-C5-methylase (TrmA/RlmC/RlmD family)
MGLDDATVELARRFPNILYISCNPQTLRDNVAALAATHEIARRRCSTSSPTPTTWNAACC